MVIKEKNREEVDNSYKWDLSNIYKSDKEYNKDLKKVKELLKEIPSFKGRITKSSLDLYEFLIMDEEISKLFTGLYVYASCMKDQNVLDEKNNKRYNEIINVSSRVDEAMSFVLPEMLKTDYSVIKEYIKENEKLKEYEFDLQQVYKYQKHVVDEDKEILLSHIEELQSDYENSSETLLDGVIKYGFIKDEEGNEVELTSGNLHKYLKSSNREVRKNAYQIKCEKINEYEQILAINYEGHLKADSFVAKEKKFDSSLEMYLFPDDVNVSVYDSLLNFAKKNLKTLHKYFKLKKDVLGLETFYDYDVNAPLITDVNHKFNFNDAKELICKALSIYGDDYNSILKSAFEEKWIDVYPNKGKTSGFYSTFGGRGNPIILANFTDDYHSVSALAHELGHSIHSYYSHHNNPFHLSEYTILVAEVASLTNEILLANYVIKNSDDKKLKLIAIYNMIDFISDNFFGTVGNGSIFEKKVHELIDAKEVIGSYGFKEINDKIKDKYYGKIVTRSIDSSSLCLAVPHYYSSFYYYKYAVGVAGACYVANKILGGDKEYLERYLNFLKLGGSMTPLDELKTIDIDLTNEEILSSCISYLDSLIDEFKKVYYEEV